MRTEPALLFRVGVFAAIAHIPMSLAIMQPAYFSEFFAEDRLSFAGEMVFLFGGLTAGGVFLLTRSSLAALIRWRISIATMCMLFLHVLSMGICRGMNVNASHAYLPPMWLLSMIGVALAIICLLMSRDDETPKSEPSLTPPPERK